MDFIKSHNSQFSNSPSRHDIIMNSKRKSAGVSSRQFTDAKTYSNDAMALQSPRQIRSFLKQQQSYQNFAQNIQKPAFHEKTPKLSSSVVIEGDSKKDTIDGHNTLSASMFDHMTHKPPRIDQFGYNIESHKGRELLNRNKLNILNENIRIPQDWNPKESNKQSSVQNSLNAQETNLAVGKRSLLEDKKTKTQLMEQRKKQNLPDISYDLDGDGLINGKDYVIARLFDQGLKNYLTEEEKQKAINALKEGFDKKFVWGVDSSGAHRPYRILQKRGVIVDADDFLGVGATYPPHPISKIEPKCKTLNELLQMRRSIERQDVMNKKNYHLNKIAHLQNTNFKAYYQPQEYVAQPKYTSLTQKVEEQKELSRLKNGLNEKFIDINTEKLHNPSISWQDKAATISKSVLNEKRRANNLSELQKLEKQIGVVEEEPPRFRPSWSDLEKTTMNARIVKENRKQFDIQDMTQKFGSQLLGIHGTELPKFSDVEQDKTYWTMQKTFNQFPKFQSQNLLQQESKYWAQNDLMKLSDTQGVLGPKDPFKMDFVKQSTKIEVAPKVNNENHWKLSDKIGDVEFQKQFKPVVKWSQIENDIKCQGKHRHQRTFDKILENANKKEADDVENQKKMEQLLIKQAPRFLQAEMTQQLLNEKQKK